MESDRLVLAVCILVSSVGAIILALDESPEKIEELSPELIGHKVVLSGIVDSKRVHDGHVFLEVNGFHAVVFEKDARLLVSPYFLLAGDNVELTGMVTDYEGTVELVVDGVRVC